MIDFAPTMDYLMTSQTQKGHTRATEYRNMDESSSKLENKVPVPTRCDLIVDSYINPSILRHMTIPTVHHHNAIQEAMKQLVGDYTTTDMDIVTSSIDKKRFRLPPRDDSTSGDYALSDVVPNTTTTTTIDGHNNNILHDPTPVVVEAMENDESTYTSKRVKRDNEFLYDRSMKEETWNFLPYPDHKDIDITLNTFDGISQLLNSWDQNPYSDHLEELDIHRRKDELVDEGCMYDVEHALLDFHVTSDDWNTNTGHIRSTTTDDTEQLYHAGPDLYNNNKCDKVSPSESSSVSSISFVEPHPVPTPPTLLRVTTSTILEEQELIWRKIKQEQHEPYPPQGYNSHAVWHHEVTRGHHLRPPLSPRSRRSNLCPTSISPGLTKGADMVVPEASSNESFGFKTPTSAKRKSKGLEPPELPTAPQSYTSFPADPPVRPVQVTPTKNDGTKLPKSLFAPCFGCQTQLQFPSSVTSSIVYCMNCGIMASSDVMRSFMMDDEEEGQNFVSFDISE